ncbi:MAG: mycothiol biosynthesis acetyltransferase [Mycobacterium sp.]|nr:mycothiol biosynthesis acetyltransferase [Mycobacterium sp.]
MRAVIEFVQALSASDVTAVLHLAGAAAAADGVAPLSEQTVLRLDHPHAGVRHALARDAKQGQPLTGYAQLELPAGRTIPATAELFVGPDGRRRGIGRALLMSLQSEAGGVLQVWAHGDHPAAAALAAGLGFARSRVLLQLRRPLSGALPEPRWPDDVTVRTFIPGQDEQAWLAVNSAAFATHPEQGRWTLDDLEQREASDWFDPAGFFLAERGGELLGFHWTKVHRDETPAIGEVYVVGVRPESSGQGLGPALTLTGLHFLQSIGLTDVLLYVDEENVPAMKTYERLGFQRWATDVLYESANT